MHDPFIRGLASDGKVKSAATRGPRVSWPGFAPQAGVFSGFQYLTVPLRLHDTTVRRHWENARKVNIAGDTVTLDPAGQVADAAWARQRLGRATQALPNGYCGLPIQQSCPHANSCLTCPVFITTAEFLPQHRAQHQQTLQIITTAEARGQARLAEMNRQVAGNLHHIITSLEADPGGNAGRPEGTANAG